MNNFKKLLILFITLAILILAACSNNEEQNLIKNNTIFLTAYKDGIFTKNKKIFEMEILIDDTKTNAMLKKEMLKGEMEYKNKLIYIDSIEDEDIELGSFDNLFFIENE